MCISSVHSSSKKCYKRQKDPFMDIIELVLSRQKQNIVKFKVQEV